jgi:hypothetical protein
MANIDPGFAFSIKIPLLWTKDTAVDKSIELDANNAEYSPSECPANKSGTNPVSVINF